MSDTPSSDFATLSQAFVQATETAGAAVVHVRARRRVGASGIAVAPDLVVTADHVVDPSRESDIRVGLPDGTVMGATLVGRDPSTDVALLRLPEARLTPARASTENPPVGTLGLVVARPGRDTAASLALVAGRGGALRTRRGGVLEQGIPIDTVMYPGFSGGALVDAAGQVLGMATSGLGLDGPALAVPWRIVAELTASIAQHGRVPRGYLGIGSQPIALAEPARAQTSGQTTGLLIVHVEEGGPAAQTGVLQGDILLQLDGTPVTSGEQLQAVLGPSRVGTRVTTTVLRGGQLTELSVTIGMRPQEP